jgi:hypothetical protein
LLRFGFGSLFSFFAGGGLLDGGLGPDFAQAPNRAPRSMDPSSPVGAGEENG